VSEIFIISELLWVWAVSLIKTSMALLLLRIRRNWLWGMLPLAAFQIIIAASATIAQFTECRPVAASWNPFLTNSRCWDTQRMKAGVYVMFGESLILFFPYTQTLR
jgi:hypothetical protein